MSTRDDEKLRADEWVFHYLRGNIKEALAVENSGPPIKPNHVIAAVIGQLADQRLALLPTNTEADTTKQEA